MFTDLAVEDIGNTEEEESEVWNVVNDHWSSQTVIHIYDGRPGALYIDIFRKRGR